MKEDFLHYIWRYQLLNKEKLITTDNEVVEIIQPGYLNRNSGPDFFNAKVKINNTVWAGNIEIHTNSSDWDKHGHNNDKAYNNVILHVVKNNDKKSFRNNGEIIPALEMEISDKYYKNFESLMKNELWIPCQKRINKVSNFIINIWLEKLMVERLESKVEYIYQVLSLNNNNWEETFYQFIARNFGFKINALSFEMLAKSLPLNILAKHKNNLLQIEAMLFGQAGFLEDSIDEDDYFNKLKEEYKFLKKKFSLKSIDKHLWKFLRLRPVNFPTVRIAQFASLIFQSTALFSKIIEAESVLEIEKYFNIQASEYWDSHYTFAKSKVKRKKQFGKTAFNTIMINTIIPFLFVYGKAKDNNKIKDKAIRFMENIQAEKNSIIVKWKEIGVNSYDAKQTQALIQLKTKYCNEKRCLDCQIGNQIIIND